MTAFDPVAVTAGLASVPGIGRVEVVPRTASTSTDLVDALRADPSAWPDRSVLLADHQAAGRGRAGRTWTTPPGQAVTVSVLLRPHVPVERLGWVPLLAGLAVVRTVEAVAGCRARLKWPNDVLVPAPDGTDLPGWGTWRKVAGVLADLVPAPGGPAVVVGMGVNVLQGEQDLPVPSASSLRLAGSAAGGHEVGRDVVLLTLVRELLDLDRRWRDAEGDAESAGLAQACAAACLTLGSRVQVELPGGEVVEGRATGLAPDGALELEAAGGRRTVHAGDVHHLRSPVN